MDHFFFTNNYQITLSRWTIFIDLIVIKRDVSTNVTKNFKAKDLPSSLVEKMLIPPIQSVRLPSWNSNSRPLPYGGIYHYSFDHLINPSLSFILEVWERERECLFVCVCLFIFIFKFHCPNMCKLYLGSWFTMQCISCKKIDSILYILKVMHRLFTQLKTARYIIH